MKKVGIGKLYVMQITVIQHALGVVDDGRQIDPIDFPAPCGEARQKETRPRPGIEGAITLPGWHQTKGNLDPLPKHPAG